MLTLRQAIIVLVVELWFCTSYVECDANFTECYNTTTEMHCFSQIVNGPLNFTEAQKRCSAIDATLPAIKNEEVQTLLETFISYLSKSGGIEDSISYYWTNANIIIETKWQWLNSSVINELNASINTGVSFDIHVASLAGQESDQQEVRLIATNPGERFSYICEFFGSDCQSQNGNVLRYGDKCYVASTENATWYDARNLCLKERGDLASFGDLKNTNINFTQWLDLSNGKPYWVGVRLLRWLWKNSGNAEVRYTSWFRRYPVSLYSTDECVSLWGNNLLNGWKTENCNQDQSVGVICYKVTSLDPSKDTTIASCPGCASSMGSFESSTEASRDIALGVGIGLGVGIPVVIAIIVIIVVCVKRKRKYRPSAKKLAANSDDCEMKDVQTDSLETKKDDDVETETGEKYWEVTKVDSASTTNEVDQVIESSAPIPNNDVGTVYSAVEFVDETDPMESNKDDVVIDEHYGEVAKIDSRSATSEENQMIEHSESHSNNGDGTDYSPTGIDEQTYPHGDGTDYSPAGIDEQTYPLEPDMDDVITDEAHWDAGRNDSSSATNEMDQVIESFESNTDNGDGTDYSAVEFVEGQDEDDLP